MNKFRSGLVRWIKANRKKRYGKITRYRSDWTAGAKATVFMIESMIIGERANWDINYARCDSPIERKLYNALRSRGYKVRTQKQCGKYQIDLALKRYKIAIECDGKKYHSSPQQKARDQRKDRFLRRNGWSVIRFTGSDINSHMPKVLSKIEAKVKGRAA